MNNKVSCFENLNLNLNSNLYINNIFIINLFHQKVIKSEFNYFLMHSDDCFLKPFREKKLAETASKFYSKMARTSAQLVKFRISRTCWILYIKEILTKRWVKGRNTMKEKNNAYKQIIQSRVTRGIYLDIIIIAV